MSQIMDVLRSEHRSIGFLLDLLERQTDLLEKTGEPDLQLIVEIIDYFRSFPDMHHHPKEDLVLRRLRERAEGLDGEFFRLDEEHEKLSGELHAFSRTAAELISDPSPMSRSSFILESRSFIERERRHMSMEERYFFPAAERWLTDADWDELDEAVNQFVDPISAPHAVQRFQMLSAQLQKWKTAAA